MSPRILSVVMGGGRGARLYPLTKERCKPAVPLAGKYRLVDIPISNCLNSGLNRIYLLTQFNTASLHRHIRESYKFDHFGGGFVDILAAEQTSEDANWYQGTADAVRQNLHHFGNFEFDYLLILSGDQLFRMNFNELIAQHIETGAEATIAAKAMPIGQVRGLGLMRVQDDLSITQFVEKPTDPAVIEDLAIGQALERKFDRKVEEKHCLASMGIYLFDREVLRKSLQNDMTDFGKEVIPSLLGKRKLCSFIFDDYWEDIGTVGAFFEANLSFTREYPSFNCFENDFPVYTHARFLPASRINNCVMDHAIVADGCIVRGAQLKESSIGVRSMIRERSTLERTVMMGGDYYETPDEIEANRARGRPDVGVGRNCVIRNAILDKNARIGDNVHISPDGHADGSKGDGYFVRDGVIVILKNAVLRDATTV
ncbi:MAG: glucose-1-phosphate adenylyltransferase [Opitutae bacterium]|nr:glucose-1-phosphate adenylyltransferase [Opitutae bacterium]